MLRVIHSILRKAIRLLSGHGFWRFYPTRIAFKFLEPRLKSNVADVQGHKMFLDSKDSLDLSIFGLYEKLETQLVKKEIWMGDVVLDIGANIGYYTLIFAKLVGENGKVYAFEPDPTNFALLEKNVKANGYENVILEQKAIANKNGKIRLYLGEANKASHTIFDTHDNRQSIEIEAIRLDDYFKDYDGRIDFIKMDIEGAEWYAIQGMALLLRKINKTKILTEFSPSGLKKRGIEPEGFLKELIKHGFKLHYINGKEEGVEPVTIDELIHNCANKEHVNLLCSK